MGDVSLLIRSATEDDLPGIVDAYLDSWRGGYEGLLPERAINVQVELRREHDWRSAILSPTSGVAVALSDDRVVGVAQATELSCPTRDLPEITMLYVRPDQWGHGIASALLASATAWIADRGHPSARLRVVEEQARARRFYEREGWHLDERVAAASNGFFALVYYRRDDLGTRSQRA
jgi:GNAT superfamily N-acetyltransferase